MRVTVLFGFCFLAALCGCAKPRLQPLIFASAITDSGPLSALTLSAEDLTKRIAGLREVSRSEFYYLQVPELSHLSGSGRLVTGEQVFWSLHFCAEGVRLRFQDGSERYFLPAEKPNKAPEPTTTAVTIRAGARLAPAAVVAHL